MLAVFCILFVDFLLDGKQTSVLLSVFMLICDKLLICGRNAVSNGFENTFPAEKKCIPIPEALFSPKTQRTSPVPTATSF